jgi:cell division septal protein FtsQ
LDLRKIHLMSNMKEIEEKVEKKEESKPEKANFFIRRKRLIFIITVSFFVVLFFVANKWRFDLNVEKIEVDGNRLLAAENIIKQSGVKVNSGLYDFDLKEIENNVNRISYVKTAIIQRELPSTLSIKIIEREPIALISSGALYYIDSDKKMMQYNYYKEILDLPIITGVKLDSSNTSPVLDTVINILITLKKDYADLYNQISEISVKNKNQIIIYSNNNCVPILIGSEDIMHKLENLNYFWKDFAIYENLKNIEFIDVRYNDQVVVKWYNKI